LDITKGGYLVNENYFIFAKHLSIIGSTMSTRADFSEIMDLVTAGKLKPILDKRFCSRVFVAQRKFRQDILDIEQK